MAVLLANKHNWLQWNYCRTAAIVMKIYLILFTMIIIQSIVL